MPTPSTENPTPLGDAVSLDKKFPSTVEDLHHTYIMFYRHGMNANLTKCFYHDGDLEAAKQRAIKHCNIMNYRFIFIRPLICDLALEESGKLIGGEGKVYS